MGSLVQIRPLLDADTLVQAALGAAMEALPIGPRTMDGVKAVVVNVYPVGHSENRLGQTLVDVQPLTDMPMLPRVPICLPHAHQETMEALEHTARRQPFAPKARNRMEGSARDLRPGTMVWVQFLGGSLHDPVVVSTMKYGQQGAGAFPLERQVVDRIQDDGSLVDEETHPLDSAIDRSDPDHVTSSYPRSADVYNGVRVEVDNRGNRYVQTSIDRDPVFPGHNGIPASPAPEGNYGVSTRGARVGHQVFTSGRHPRFPDEPSQGRQGRRTIDADDGTIRDSTRSSIGNLIQRLRSTVGRYYLSTKGSGDGGVYLEDAHDNYFALIDGGAELHGAEQVVLDSAAVKLGSGEAALHAVLWEQLVECLQALVDIYDQHTHPTAVPGPPSVPTQKQGSTFAGQKETFKSEVVTLDKDAAASPSPQDDPET